MMTVQDLYTLSGTLLPQPPFDFTKTLSFLEGFGPTASEQALVEERVIKAVTLSGRAVAFELWNEGTLEAPALGYKLYAEQPLSNQDRAALEDRIRFFLSLDDDMKMFYQLGQADAHFAPIIQRLYGLHHAKFLTPFELACWAILGQRIPWRVAHNVKMALVERWGASITLPSGVYQAFPEVAQLATATNAELVEVVRNGRKVEYLRAVIDFFLETQEDFLRHGPYEEVSARIRSVRGMGEWSTHFLLVRGLGRMERLSLADKELSKAAARVYHTGSEMSAKELQRLFDYYGTNQGYWALYTRINSLPQFL